jgi:hypothetical protein
MAKVAAQADMLKDIWMLLEFHLWESQLMVAVVAHIILVQVAMQVVRVLGHTYQLQLGMAPTGRINTAVASAAMAAAEI